MSFRRERRKRRLEEEAETRKRAPGGRFFRGSRGGRFTFFSFFAIVVCLAGIKAARPDLSLAKPFFMTACAAIACILMAAVARRRK